MAKRRKPTKREMKEAKKLLNEDGYIDQFLNAQGHLVAKNTQWGMSVTASLKDGSNLVEHVKQQIKRNFKQNMLEVGLPAMQRGMRDQMPAYPDLTITAKSTNLKEFVDKTGKYTGTKGQTYYRIEIAVDYNKEN